MASIRQPRKLPCQRRSRATFEALLDAAADILLAEGREAVTTNAVAARAEVSIGSLYQYFPGRDSLFLALAQRHGRRIHAAAEAALTDRPDTLEEAVAQLVDAVFAAHEIEPGLHDALHSDLAHRHDPEQLGICALMRSGLADLEPRLLTEIGHPDLDRAAWIASEITHALAHAATIAPDPERGDVDLRGEAVHAVLAYLRSTPNISGARPGAGPQARRSAEAGLFH